MSDNPVRLEGVRGLRAPWCKDEQAGNQAARANELIASVGDSLFAPQSIQDVRDRLARIEAAGCPCVESPHLNALHDLAHDDVPVLISALETQAAEVEKLRGALETIRGHCIDLGRPLHHIIGDILALTDQIEGP